LHFTVTDNELLIHLARPSPVWPHYTSVQFACRPMVVDDPMESWNPHRPTRRLPTDALRYPWRAAGRAAGRRQVQIRRLQSGRASPTRDRQPRAARPRTRRRRLAAIDDWRTRRS